MALGIALYTDWRASTRIKAERQLAREHEQFAEAYAVQIEFDERDPGTGPPDVQGHRAPSGARDLAAMMVNRGSFTITQIEAQFCLADRMIPHLQRQHISGVMELPELLRGPFVPTAASERIMYGVLPPWDVGIRFEVGGFDRGDLFGWYPVVRWTDRWGTRWEHKRGVVRPVSDDEPWGP